jgi:hypothetical protein
MTNIKGIIWEKSLMQNVKFDNEGTNIEKFDSLLNLSLIPFDIRKANSTLILLNHLFEILSTEIDEFYLKYFNKFSDIYKEAMNIFKSKSYSEHIHNGLFGLVENLNINFSTYVKHFHKNYQNYNDKHKNVLKFLPNFLKLYFKLFEDNFECIKVSNEAIESFFMTLISLIIYYPTLIRPFQNRIEVIFKNIFTTIISTSTFIDNKSNNLKTYCLSYVMLFRLSPDPSSKFNPLLERILKHLEFYLLFFAPKNLKSKSTFNNSSTEDGILTSINIFDQKDIANDNFFHAHFVIKILMKMIKCLFKSIPKNATILINFKILIDFLLENIQSNKNKERKADYVLEGLSNNDYQIFQEILSISSIKLINFLIKNYSTGLYYYIPLFKKTVSKLIISDIGHNKTSEKFSTILKHYKIIVKYYSSLMLPTIEEIVYKCLINNFIDIFVNFLERNDKTIVKLDNNYFKLSKIKNNSVGKGKTNKVGMSLIQKARQDENAVKNMNNFSDKELEQLLIQHLKIFKDYFKCECFHSLLKNEDNIILIQSLVDLVILPSYAKFIFNLSMNVKHHLLDFIYEYAQNSFNNVNLNRERLFLFAKCFYSDEQCHYKIDRIFNILNVNKNKIGNDSENELTKKFIDFNQRISEKLRERYENTLENIEIRTNVSNKIELDLHDYEEVDIHTVLTDIKTAKTTQPILSADNYNNFKPNASPNMNSKWKLTKNENEFISSDNITLILHQKDDFLNKFNETPRIEQRNTTQIENTKTKQNNTNNFKIEISKRDDSNINDLEIPDLL